MNIQIKRYQIADGLLVWINRFSSMLARPWQTGNYRKGL
jgi:hypothetical protein